MLRIILSGVGLLTTAIAGYYATKKLSRRSRQAAEELPEEPDVYQPGPRVRKSRRSPSHQPLVNGEPDLSEL